MIHNKLYAEQKVIFGNLVDLMRQEMTELDGMRKENIGKRYNALFIASIISCARRPYGRLRDFFERIGYYEFDLAADFFMEFHKGYRDRILNENDFQESRNFFALAYRSIRNKIVSKIRENKNKPNKFSSVKKNDSLLKEKINQIEIVDADHRTGLRTDLKGLFRPEDDAEAGDHANGPQHTNLRPQREMEGSLVEEDLAEEENPLQIAIEEETKFLVNEGKKKNIIEKLYGFNPHTLQAQEPLLAISEKICADFLIKSISLSHEQAEAISAYASIDPEDRRKHGVFSKISNLVGGRMTSIRVHELLITTTGIGINRITISEGKKKPRKNESKRDKNDWISKMINALDLSLAKNNFVRDTQIEIIRKNAIEKIVEAINRGKLEGEPK